MRPESSFSGLPLLKGIRDIVDIRMVLRLLNFVLPNSLISESLFPTYETELEYYHQKINVPAASWGAERIKI